MWYLSWSAIVFCSVYDSRSCGIQVLPKPSQTHRKFCSIVWEPEALVGGLNVGSEQESKSCLSLASLNGIQTAPEVTLSFTIWKLAPFTKEALPVCCQSFRVFLEGMQRKLIFSLTFIHLSPSVSHPLSARRVSCFVDRGHLSANGSDVMRLVRLDRPHFKNRPKGQCISIASIQTWHSFPRLRPSMGIPIFERPNHQPLIYITFIMPGFILRFSHLTCWHKPYQIQITSDVKILNSLHGFYDL